MADTNYNAEQIQVLEGLDPVRKRPGMYIGSTGEPGLHHLVTEIVNNSMDEAMGGYANHIKVEFLKDGSVAVYDNGRGIPFEIHKKHGVSALELVFTKLHAGGKFGGDGYKVSSGLHGVGSSVVNALSHWMRVVVKRGDKYVIQEYKDGGQIARPVEDLDPKKPVTKLKADFNLDLDSWNYESGSIVQFQPDDTIFETVDFKLPFFIGQIREYAYLTAGIKFDIIDHRSDKAYSFYFEGGLKSYLKSLNRNKKILNTEPFHVAKQYEDVNVEVALQYTDSFGSNVLTFANHLKNSQGGTHLTGFKSALTRTINDYAKKSGLIKNGDSLSGDDIQEGVTAIVSVTLEELQFEGQTKAKLGSSIARPAVESVMKEALEIYLDEHPNEAKAILDKNMLALKARLAAKAARETVIRKSALDGGGVLPGKLSDCSSKKPEECEIFIVEGDSAGGTARNARNRKTQAILPLFGKPLNTEKARLDKVISNNNLKELVVAIGAGIGEHFDPESLRYHKIIIMADADIDGQHIMTLYLAFFFRHMRQLIEGGYVYSAVPPLFKAVWGKEKRYLFDEAERDEFLKNPPSKNVIVQRFKGLGEMNVEELEDTTMSPETRKLLQLNIEDAEKADQVFTMLMGSEVPPRKRFIQTHAKNANIDKT